MASEGSGDAQEGSLGPSRVEKPKRKRVKRDGKPPLQFIVSTSDLSEFRDEGVKRNVRSQAMMAWRHKDREKRGIKGKGRAPSDDLSDEPSNELAVEPSIEPYNEPSDLEPFARESPASPDDVKPKIEDLWLSASDTPMSSSGVLDAPSSSSHVLDEPQQDHEMHDEEQDAGLHSHEPSILSPSFESTSSQSLVLRKTVDYEETEEHEAQTYKRFIQQLTSFYHIGNGADPFDALPQFQNPELSALYLTRNSIRVFTTKLTMEKWFPAIVSHPHIILSSTCLVATWLDMKQGHSGDSKRTAMVKEEIFSMLNQRLQDPRLQGDDTTLMGILHVLAGEMWNCDENALRVHIRGVAQFVRQRGGLEKLGRNEALADVAVSCCHCDILFETQPLPIFYDWEPAPVDLTVRLPESPIFCPLKELHTLKSSRRCRVVTFGLLCDMRNLTMLVLDESTRLSDSPGIKLEKEPVPFNYDDIVIGIQQRLFALPSACTPGLAVSNDWVYEACRIASLIYTAAIVERMPFSEAGGSPDSPLRDPALPNTNSRLVESLYETLKRCDMFDVWDDMAGVLYWVSSVGAAAARAPLTTVSPAAQTQEVAYRIWVQRCLTMYSVRTMVIVIFEHPSAIIHSQKALLRVQRLLDRKTRTM